VAQVAGPAPDELRYRRQTVTGSVTLMYPPGGPPEALVQEFTAVTVTNLQAPWCSPAGAKPTF